MAAIARRLPQIQRQRRILLPRTAGRIVLRAAESGGCFFDSFDGDQNVYIADHKADTGEAWTGYAADYPEVRDGALYSSPLYTTYYASIEAAADIQVSVDVNLGFNAQIGFVFRWDGSLNGSGYAASGYELVLFHFSSSTYVWLYDNSAGTFEQLGIFTGRYAGPIQLQAAGGSLSYTIGDLVGTATIGSGAGPLFGVSLTGYGAEHWSSIDNLQVCR